MTKQVAKFAVVLVAAAIAAASGSGCAHSSTPKLVDGMPVTPANAVKVPDGVREQFYANKKLKNGD